MTALLLFSCSRNQEDSLTKESIDQIVDAILDSNRVYNITESLNFSNDTEQYSVTSYSEKDSSILYVESFSNPEYEYSRQLYLNDGKVIFIKELGYRYNAEGIDEEYEQNVYVLNENSIKSYEKILSNEDAEMTEINLNLDQYDFKKPADALGQKGEFEMKFGEFLSIEPQTYLILENKESQYQVALYITESDFLLDELYMYPSKYKGKTIFANHESVNMGGIIRMVYKGGFLIEH